MPARSSLFEGLQITPSSESERCCLCLHVRFATILLGCYLIVLNTSLILFMPLSNQHFMLQNNDSYIHTELGSKPLDTNGQAASTMYHDTNGGGGALDEGDNGLVETEQRVEPLKHFLQIAVAMMLVYGAYSYKSMYLMPFMCIQFFQILQTLLAVAGWLTHAVRDYNGNRSRGNGDQENAIAPHEKAIDKEPATIESLSGNAPFGNFTGSSYEFLFGVLIFFVYINIFIYMLNIVWRCYKFILRHNREQLRNLTNAANGGGGSDGANTSFWYPDGSVVAPVSFNWLNDLEEGDGDNNNAANGTSDGTAFKLPKYSEVAKDPEGKKFTIVNIPPPTGAQSNLPPDDTPAPSYSASAMEVNEEIPPPSALPPVDEDASSSDLPPSYEQVSSDNITMAGPPTVMANDGECGSASVADLSNVVIQEEEHQFNGTLQIETVANDNATH